LNILLTGVNGQVGRELQHTLADLGKVIAADRQMLDLASADSIRAFVRECRPDMIVNPAAYTAVDRAESEPELAAAINARAPAELAIAAAELGIPIVHFSTDYVYDGSKVDAYVETDATTPQNVYGRTKLAGEHAIVASGAAHLIFRTSWVYGLHGKNFLLTMQRLARERAELRVVADQFGAPTWSRAIAVASAACIARWLQDTELTTRSGVYHLSCGGRTSWHGFTAAILAQMQADGETVATLHAIPGSEYPTPARRPQNSVLSNARLAQTFDVRMPDWDQALAQCLDSVKDLPL
jgi:dTDP-4-dehydrorhamnose reductase